MALITGQFAWGVNTFTGDRIWRLERILGEMCQEEGNVNWLEGCRADIYVLHYLTEYPLPGHSREFYSQNSPYRSSTLILLFCRSQSLASRSHSRMEVEAGLQYSDQSPSCEAVVKSLSFSLKALHLLPVLESEPSTSSRFPWRKKHWTAL